MVNFSATSAMSNFLPDSKLTTEIFTDLLLFRFFFSPWRAGVTRFELSKKRRIMWRANAGLSLALALAMLTLVSGQFFVNLGDKTKAPGTDVDAAAGQGSVPAAPAAADGDLQAQADPNVKLQVKISNRSSLKFEFWKIYVIIMSAKLAVFIDCWCETSGGLASVCEVVPLERWNHQLQTVDQGVDLTSL
jgi:hypothetical protein